MTLCICDLKEDVQVFEITGTVVSKTSEREYANKNGNGKFFSFVMKDDSGSIRVTVFNNMVDAFITVVEIGALVCLSNGRIKRGMNGNLEITSSYSTMIKSVEIQTEEKITAIGDIKATDSFVSVVGIVKNCGASQIISTRRGELVKKRELLIYDDTSKSIKWTRWAQEAEDEISANSMVKIKFAKVNNFCGLELTGGIYQKLEKGPKYKNLQQFTKRSRRSEILNVSEQATLFKDIDITLLRNEPKQRMIFHSNCVIQDVCKIYKYYFCHDCFKKCEKGNCPNCGSESNFNFVATLKLSDGSNAIQATVFKDVAEKNFGSEILSNGDNLDGVVDKEFKLKMVAFLENETLKFKIVNP